MAELQPRKIDPELLHICDVCRQIGFIDEANYHYQAGIQREIAKTGKPIEQLTVADLLEIDNRYGELFNRTYRNGGKDRD